MNTFDLINIFFNSIEEKLANRCKSIYLYGSYAINDYKAGYSDIDFIIFTNDEIKENDKTLIKIREELEKEYNDEGFKQFEGIIVEFNSFKEYLRDTNQNKVNNIYFGKTNSKFKKELSFDSFSVINLIENGYLFKGEDIKYSISKPSSIKIFKEIQYFLQEMKEHGKIDDDIHSLDWIYNGLRCIYTMREDSIISKSNAILWAIENNIYDEEVLYKLLEIRTSPQLLNRDEVKKWIQSLNPLIQHIARNLEAEIKLNSSR